MQQIKIIPTPQREEIGIDVLEEMTRTMVNLGEALANSDTNGDGKISTTEVFGAITLHTGTIFNLVKNMPAAVAEGKDITIKEAATILIVAVEEIDVLSLEQKEWIRDVIYHGSELSSTLLEAKNVFTKK